MHGFEGFEVFDEVADYVAPCYCQRRTAMNRVRSGARVGMDDWEFEGEWTREYGDGNQWDAGQIGDMDQGYALLNLAYNGSDGSPNSSDPPVDERTGICGSVGDVGEEAEEAILSLLPNS